MVKRILALSLLMVGLVACGGQEDPAGELLQHAHNRKGAKDTLDGLIWHEWLVYYDN